MLERRVQLLLDQERYDRVAEQASRTGRSVNAVIRDAIDLHVDDSHRRADAVRWLLDHSAQPDEGPSQDWGTVQTEMDRELSDRWG